MSAHPCPDADRQETTQEALDLILSPGDHMID
jgi:hypothetical protein